MSFARAIAVLFCTSHLILTICKPLRLDWSSKPRAPDTEFPPSNAMEDKVTLGRNSKQSADFAASIQDKTKILTNTLLKACPPMPVVLLQQLLRLSVRDLTHISSMLSVRQE